MPSSCFNVQCMDIAKGGRVVGTHAIIVFGYPRKIDDFFLKTKYKYYTQ